MEEAYKMDDHVRILCQDHYCSLTCKRGVEIPQVSKIVCKNARRNKTGFEQSQICVVFFCKLSVFAFRELNLKNRWQWGPKPAKVGAVGCGLPKHQTKCGPITQHFRIEHQSGVKVTCENNKCRVECPQGKFHTLPNTSGEAVCRNAR